jgi:6-phosphogluconolactonase
MMVADAPAIDMQPPQHVIVYASGSGGSIAWFEIDRATAALTPSGSVTAFAANPSFLAITHSARFLYAVSESTDRVGAYAIDPASGALAFLNDTGTGGSGPAHVSVDDTDEHVLVANYGDGSVSVIPIHGDGSLGAATQTVVAGKNAHQILTRGTFAFVPCLGSDYIAQYTYNGMLAPNAVPHVPTAAGAGPRHLAFAPDGAHAYLIDETASTMTALAYDAAAGQLSPLVTVSTLQAPVAGNTGAEVVATGKVVYGSNRGDNSIVTMAAVGDTLQALAWTPSGGTTPRSFAVHDDLLVVANQGTGNLAPMKLGADGGPISSAPTVPFAGAEFVAFVALP